MASRRTEEMERKLTDALVQSAFATIGILTVLATEHDLSLTQLRVGGILRDRRVRMNELASYLRVEKSTITGLVDRAEKRGLMARAPNVDDGRATDVFLTKEGLRLAVRVESELEGAMAPLVARLSVVDRRKLRELLERLLDGPEGSNT